MKKRATADGIAPELGDEQNGSGSHEEDAGEVSVLAAMGQPENKANGNDEETERDVGLHRMDGNAERRSAPSLGERDRCR